ncbi:MAG: hypothetical protein ACJ763_16705 [Bdellovibrionia bacterium]
MLRFSSNLLLMSAVLLSQSSMASVSKKSKTIDLGLVRKTASSDDEFKVEFKPETNPNKRGIEKERYSALDRLEWQNSDALSAQKAVNESHSQIPTQQLLNQPLQSLPKFSIQNLPVFKASLN